MRECFDRHGCDKGRRHGYERVYEPAFSDVRYEPLYILEVGIYKGASLAAWVDYFPNATIVGIDTFGRIKPSDIPILNHPRVEWHYHDSTMPIVGLLTEYCRLKLFDIVIDDGLHTHTSQRKTFECLMPYAVRYFIEDVWALDYMTPAEKKHKWLKNDGYSDGEYQKLMNALKPHDVKFHDLRTGYQPDSFIIEVADAK